MNMAMNVMENSEWAFVWKDHLFVSGIHKNQLLLKWVLLNPLKKSNFVTDREHSSTDSPEQPIENEPPSSSTITLDLDKEKEYKLLSHGFSFDPGYFDNVPVMVLGVYSPPARHNKGSKENVAHCLFISVKVKSIGFGTFDFKNSTSFEFVVVQKFQVNGKFTTVLTNKTLSLANNVQITSQFHMIHLATSSSTLDLYSVAGVTSYSLESYESCPSSNQCKILDTFCNYVRHETFVLYSYVDDNGMSKFKCIKFLHGNSNTSFGNTSQRGASPKKYTEVVSPKHMFPSDYLQIISAVKIISLSSKQCRDDFASYSSNVIILTNTGYLIHFVDGTMSACIHIWSSLHESGSFTQLDWDMAKFDFVTMRRGSTERIALQVNSTCLLIDVAEEQVVRMWQSVSLISSITNQSSAPCLVMVMRAINGSNESSWELIDDKENIHVIDCYAINIDTAVGEMEFGLQRQPSEKSSTSKLPQCAVDALIAQKKKYENTVRESKIELAAKEQFLMETWQKLQDFSLTASKRHSNHTHSHLVPLWEGCAQTEDGNGDYPAKSECNAQNWQPDDSHGSSRMSNRASSHIVVIDEPWKRIFKSLLVVGLLVKNVCDRPINGAHIHLIPKGVCLPSMCECVSSSNGESEISSNISSSISSAAPLLNASSDIQPGSEQTLTCYVDTAQILSPDDVRFSVITSYSIGDSKAKRDKSLDVHGKENHPFNISCGDIRLLAQDLISGAHSLEHIFSHLKMQSSGKKDPSTADTLALNCIQNSLNLIIKSKVSSVLCLGSRLSAHPDFLTSSCGYYIFVADHQLRLCRVRINEQISKKMGKFHIFTRTDNQAVLLVKFLYSILPDDVTILPDLVPPSASLQQASDTLHQELQDKIAIIEKELEDTEEKTYTGSENDGAEMSSSPTFHSKKKMHGKIDDAGLNTGARLDSKVKTGGESSVDKERHKFLRAKRRIKEKFGFDGDS